MHKIDLAAADLNLLVVLDVLLEERSVTRTAKRLHRTQSATSHALARLREQLGDPLLVRVGNEMRPTPRAVRLAPELSRLLRALSGVLAQEDEFDLATTERTFGMAAPDFVSIAFPDIVARMARAAPAASLELVPISRDMFRNVSDGRCDLAVAPPRGKADDGLRSEDIATLEWAVFAREGHPAIPGWGRKAWARYAHIRVRTSSGGESPVERAASSARVKRKAGPILPHFLLAPSLLAKTDLLMTVPRAILADVAPRFGLVVLPCPVKLEPIALALYWSAILDQDPALVWFRSIAKAGLQESFAPSSGLGKRKRKR